jgi:hypothetical protein
VRMELAKPLEGAAECTPRARYGSGAGGCIASRYVDDAGSAPGCSQGCPCSGALPFHAVRTASGRKLTAAGAARPPCARDCAGPRGAFSSVRAGAGRASGGG